MLSFGVIVVLGGIAMRRQDARGLAPLRVIAACYLLFGLSAFFALGFAPHFIGFIVIGLLAGLPTLGWKPAPREGMGCQIL